MDKGRRRRRSVVLFGFVALFIGGLVALLAFLGRPEAVVEYRAVARVADDGHARVDESIRYRFPQSRHGIYRILPDVPISALGEITVSSDNTDQYLVLPEGRGVRIKIGNPNKTIAGEHDYAISYPLNTVDLGGGRFAWNGVGASWDVPVEHVDLDLVAPWTWQDPICNIGASGSIATCTVTQSVPGRLEVSSGRLAVGEGITVYARRGAALAATPEPRQLSTTAASMSWTQRPLVLGGIGAILALAGSLVFSALARRAGRDQVIAGAMSTGGAADVALGPPGDGSSTSATTRVDDTELDGWATTAFSPPRALVAWQGGVIASETPRPSASVAWLLGAVERDLVTLDEHDPKHPVLGRSSGTGDPEITALLDVAFAGRASITLGSYDSSFTAMWRSLPAKMKQWYKASGFSDPEGDRRARTAILCGVIGVVLTSLLLIGAAHASFSHPLGGFIGVSIGAAAFGVALASVARSWELRVRTPAGSAMWLQIESFRRFIANSEAEHVRQAAERGLLREYTAWAVALDEVDHWTKAVQSAGLAPTTMGLSTALVASSISSSMISAGTTPSSSGGGGGVGGGGGGGGGGSW